ncbi:flagellin N-terminal helical domain-containing protein [Nocardioides campestrisoli]|uniref:flagellin N-terminal helical domain-containing protein n=1 Tax=Nocardioides campestrisoli TaxID=2736757 RepID=UPI00163D54CF|nr:flagellin [Nocardioides campestrisoli]
MSLRINQNIDAMSAYRNLSTTSGQMAKSLEKLSSGFRINRAGDDAAGLAISEGLRSQVGGLKMGARNAQDGVSLVQTAEGALTEVHSMLQRMNDLATQYNNGTQGDDSKSALEAEFNSLKTEIGRIQENTKFNGEKIFTGQATAPADNPTNGDKTFQVGFDSSDTITVTGSKALLAFAGTPNTATPPAASNGEGIQGLEIKFTAAGADPVANPSSGGSNAVQAAIKDISTQRAELGAIQNRFEHTIANVNVAVENLSAAESRIRDTDMAQEMMNFTRSQILSQAGTAMLAQANQAPQGVLSLLR